MKKWSYLSFIMVILIACTTVDKKEQEINKTEIEVTFSLFHQAFFDSGLDDIPKLKKEYPYMFPAIMPDSLVIKRMTDTIQRDLYTEVKEVYGNFETEKKQLIDLFKHIQFYDNNFKIPTVVTDITGISYQNRVLFANDLLLISLDMYLGSQHEFYLNFSGYLTETFTPSHLTTDVAKKIIETKYRKDNNRTFLGQMIFEGKKLYLLDLFLPHVPDHIKLGYTPPKMDWSKNNEASIWAYFIKNEMLYSNNPKLKQRFIELAPFSKFFKSIDKDSPGGIAKYIGLQIVRSYMKEHVISPQELMNIEAQVILSNSNFKPYKK